MNLLSGTHLSNRRASDTLETSILAFFDRNPDEELAPSDAAKKFGVRADTTASVMRAMGDRGLLAKRREGRFIVYSAAGTP